MQSSSERKSIQKMRQRKLLICNILNDNLISIILVALNLKNSKKMQKVMNVDANTRAKG